MTSRFSLAGKTFDLRLILAIAAVWILWGSTLAGMRFALTGFPPFVMASLRFIIAGLIMLGICGLRGKLRIRREDLVRAAVTGASLLLFGNGITAYTVQFLPTGINSMLYSLAPAWMAGFTFAWTREVPTRRALCGMLLGLAGLALLLQPKATGALPLWPTMLGIFAGISWAFGSAYQRHAPRSRSLSLATALQMLAGGLFIGVEAAILGEWHQLGPHALTLPALGGMAWLILGGSLVSYSAYLYTMHAAGTALAGTYAYINPVVAVILGVILFHESFTPLEAFADLVILSGVALMVFSERSTVSEAP